MPTPANPGHLVDDEIRTALYIAGRWEPWTGPTIDVIDPTTETRLGVVPDATEAEVDHAVSAAVAASGGWSSASIEERARALTAFADALESRAEGLAVLIAREVGSPLPFARGTQVGLPIAVARAMADTVRSFAWEEPIDRTLVIREAVGVVAAITPWNYPLHQAVAKLSAALGAGCAVVLKPSGVCPLSAFVLAEIADETGLPPGVFNLVTGRGATVGERLASHPQVDAVSLTGSTAAGTRIMELAAPTPKRVTLELGGKSATVVLNDVDLDAVIPNAVIQCFRNTGQNCSALSRLIVPRRWHAEVDRLAVAAAETVVAGDPLVAGTTMGPLVSASQRDQVRALMRCGIEEGATLIAGGLEPPAGLDRGFFFRPSVFSGVHPSMRIAREEIFGPVLSILTYSGDDDAAVELANDSAYGLSGAVWSSDPDRAERVGRRMRTGRVAINGGPMSPSAPFGGYKASGIGRELGRYGLEEYLEAKTLQR